MKKIPHSDYEFWKLIGLPLLVLFLFFAGKLPAQETESWSISTYTAYSQPIGGLKDWFKPDFGLGLSAGTQYNRHWFIEGLLEYDRFDRENVDSYVSGKVQLSLEHIAILLSGRYTLIQHKIFQPYFNLAAGIYHWIGVRGAIAADSTLYPYIPPIAERKIEETNWGFHSGLGLEIKFLAVWGIDVQANYRFIVGDLWPTLQPGVELEGVSGFQTVNYRIAIRYYF